MIDRPEPGTIPTGPGAYLFKDAEGRVIYVGKAKGLRSRLSNYFGPPSSMPERTRQMVAVAESVEWIEVRNEVEAFFLEFNLIKRHRPRFNVRLKDDKSYPFLAVTLDEEWPRAMVMRGAKRKGVRYYGPFAHAYAIRETLDLLLRTFPDPHVHAGEVRSAPPTRTAVPLRPHREVRGAVRRGRAARGVRPARRRSARVPRRRSLARPRPARQADARAPPTRSSTSARRACATRSRRCARSSSVSRWSAPRRRTSIASASPRMRSRRRCRCSSCGRAGWSGARASWSTRSRTSNRPRSSAAFSSSSTATSRRPTCPARSSSRCCPTTRSCTRSS